MEREAKTIYPTMKLTTTTDEDIPFKKCKGTIKELKDVETKYGTRLIATIESGEEIFGVFVNNHSLRNLINKHGPNDDKWLGKEVEITKDTDKTFNKEMIVLLP